LNPNLSASACASNPERSGAHHTDPDAIEILLIDLEVLVTERGYPASQDVEAEPVRRKVPDRWIRSAEGQGTRSPQLKMIMAEKMICRGIIAFTSATGDRIDEPWIRLSPR
jgi:hypothetical protein